MKCRFALAAFAAFFCGCATEHYVTDARHPEIAITEAGGVTYRGEFVDIDDLPGLLRSSGLSKRDTINIHIPDNLSDMRIPRRVMGVLSRNGFTRPMLVTDRKSYTNVGLTPDERRRQQQRQQPPAPIERPPARRRIRYK